MHRRLPTTLQKWDPAPQLAGNIAGEIGINRARLQIVMMRFLFVAVIDSLADDNPDSAPS